MDITIQLSREVEERLRDAAEQGGLDPNDFARRLLEGILAVGPNRIPFWLTATKEEWLKSFNAWMDSHDRALPSLTDSALNREDLYGDRG
jgi:hypothetical protein